MESDVTCALGIPYWKRSAVSSFDLDGKCGVVEESSDTESSDVPSEMAEERQQLEPESC